MATKLCFAWPLKHIASALPISSIRYLPFTRRSLIRCRIGSQRSMRPCCRASRSVFCWRTTGRRQNDHAGL